MRIAKKLLCGMMAFALVIALAGCGQSVPAASNGDNGGSESTTVSENNSQSTLTTTGGDSDESVGDIGDVNRDVANEEEWFLIKKGGTEDEPDNIYEYDENWVRLRQIHFSYSSSGAVTGETVFTYDSTGKHYIREQYGKDGILQDNGYRFEYDDQGRLIRQIRIDSDEEYVSEVWEYNSDGSHRTTSYNRDGSVQATEERDSHSWQTSVTQYKDGEVYYTYTYENEYNDAGDIIKRIGYDKDGTAISVTRKDYQYNDQGKKLFCFIYSSDSETWEIESEYVYDEHGLEIYYNHRDAIPSYSEYVNAAGEHVNGYTMDIEPYRIAPHLPE